MKRFRATLRRVALTFLCLAVETPTAIAQYMYLDANQDGIHTAADVVNPTGSTTLDVWFRTDSNRDGSPATCSTGDGPLTMRDYQLILHASDGTVSWGPYTNAQNATMPSLFASEFDTTEAYVWFSGLTALPPGSYKLGTISVTVVSGTPSLSIASDSHLSAAYVTAFRSACSGTDFDNYLKLGPNAIGPGDWFDTDGLPFGGAVQHAPMLAQISDLTINEGQADSLDVSATDVDGDPVTFYMISGPAYMQVTTVDPGTGTATGRIHLRPGYTDAGIATATVGISDGGRAAQGSFRITVMEVDRRPVLVQPTDMVVEEEGYGYQPLRASDPDGQPVFFSKISGPPYMNVITGYGPGPFIEVLAPSRSGGRMDSATVAASDGFLFDQKSFLITVKHQPALVPPTDMVVRVGTTADQPLSASDADGDPLTFSKFSGPYFVTVSTVDPGHGLATGLIHVAPGTFNTGHFQVIIGVDDDLSSTQSGSPQASLQVTVVDPLGGSPSAGLFTSPFLSFDAGENPSSFGAGDFNRDGRLDVVVGNSDFYTREGLSVFQGRGDGSFLARTRLPVQGAVRSVGLADFNGDQLLDIAAAINEPGHVAVLLGHGDGTFSQAVEYPVGLNCAAVAVGDINGDGFADFAASSVSDDRIRIWVNRGDGTFETFHDLPSGRYPAALALEDMDHDGSLDLLVGNLESNIDFIRGHGDGTFDVSTPLPARSSVLTIGDVNVDGYKDLILPNSASNAVTVFLGTSAGFGTLRRDSPVGNALGASAIADFNHDGKPDLAVANGGVDSVFILWGDGAGGFSTREGFGTGAQPGSILTADLNTDGSLDIVTTSRGGGAISVSLGNPDGTFSRPGQISATLPHPTQSASADFNRDGHADLAVLDPQVNRISLLYGTPRDTFEPSASFETGLNPQAFVVGDWNGDGYPDLVSANYDANSISVFLNQGGATFGRQDVPVIHPTALAYSDLNDDGALDLVIASEVEVYQVGVTIMLGQGDGTFTKHGAVAVSTNFGIQNVAIANIDGDANLDVITLGTGGLSSAYTVLHGNGDGTFTGATGGYLDTEYRRLIVTDLNHDGKADLAMTGLFNPPPIPNGFVAVLLGNGDGTFGLPTNFETGYVPQAVTAADFNGDGHFDLATVNGYANTVSLLLGNGDGTFGTRIDFGAGRFPRDVIATDLNGDGRMDLVSSDQGGGTVTLLLNRGTAPPNRAPVAHAGGPYAGTVGVPIAFNGASSSDPDGSALTYRWTFGDGAESGGAEPSHTYRVGGTFPVALQVSDGALEGRDTTSADVSDALPARAFLTLRAPMLVGAGSPSTCFRLEPVGGDYMNSEVVVSSIVLKSLGTGSLSEIPAVQGKESRVSDLDRNGVSEISTCFRREDLNPLFATIHGKMKVPVSLEGNLATGARFRALLEITVMRPGGSSFAYVSPNPLRSGGAISFLNPETGSVRVQLFDVSGRLVRTITDRQVAEGGLVSVTFDGRSNAGAAVPSGIYFYKIVTTKGKSTGRVVFVR